MLFLIMVTRATSFFSQCHSMSRVLFSDDSDDERVGEDVQLTINEHYASAFEYRKEREELERRNVDFSPFRSHTTHHPQFKRSMARITIRRNRRTRRVQSRRMRMGTS